MTVSVHPAPTLVADPALRPRPPRRPRRGRPLVVASLLLHGLAALLLVLALWRRERPAEPLPPPAVAMYFESGAPDRPAEPEGDAPAEPPAPPPALPMPPAPPAAVPLPPEAPTRAEPVPPPPAPPRPDPRMAELPTPPMPGAIPLPPPPPAPPRPETAPPRPPPQRLPGIYMPEALALVQPRPAPSRPSPSRPEAPRRRLDLDLGALPSQGRFAVEPQAEVRGAQVGPDWRNAFRRWLDENKRYPENARVVGQQGTNRVEVLVAPDGTVRGARLIRQSGSVWLDAGTLGLFRGARLPPFPPGADPSGVTIDLTIHYVLIN